MFSSNKKAKMLNNINQHLKHLKKSTQRLWDGDNIQIIGQACIIVSRLYFMKSWTDHWSHKTFKSNNIKLLITLLGIMVASAGGGGGLPGSLGTGIIIINIIV